MRDKFTKVYCVNVSDLENENLMNKALESLTPERRKKTLTFRFQKDRALSAGAELLLKYALKNEGIKNELHFFYGAEGKPYLKNCDLYFNISHSEEYVICSLSKYENGCDIEKIKKENLHLAKRFFHENEYNALISRKEGEDKDLFFRLWTLKESYMKAIGKGMSIPLNSFCINLNNDITVESEATGKSFSFCEFSNVKGYCCAVCTTENDVKTEFITLELKNII